MTAFYTLHTPMLVPSGSAAKVTFQTLVFPLNKLGVGPGFRWRFTISGSSTLGPFLQAEFKRQNGHG